MKSNVEFSTSSWLLTLFITIALGIGLAFSYGVPAAYIPIMAIVLPIYLAGLCFSPMSISADEKEICINSSFKIRSVSMADVVKAERYRPLPGTIRACGSSGFMGYWGTFRDSVIGKYTGFWGNHSDCFLVTLANGKKYLLGCKNPDAMVEYINSQIEKSEPTRHLH